MNKAFAIISLILVLGCGEKETLVFNETEVIGLDIEIGDKNTSEHLIFRKNIRDGIGKNIVVMNVVKDGIAVGPVMYWKIDNEGKLIITDFENGNIVTQMEKLSLDDTAVCVLVNGIEKKYKRK